MPAVDLLSQSLSRLRARYAQSPLPRFLAWWGGELRDLLPERWRRVLTVEEARLVLDIDADALRVQRVLGAASTELARLPLTERDALAAQLEQQLDEDQRGLRRTFLLPAGMVLRRTLPLPAAALDNLRTVLGFELDRQTPFKPDQVVFDARVLPHEPGSRQVPVELALVPRDRLQQALSEIDGVAATLGAVDAKGADARPMGYNFLPPEQRRQHRNTRAWVHAGLIATSVMFLLIAMGRLLDNRVGAVDALRADVEAQRNEARAVSKLRNSLEDAATAANFLAIEKARQPSMVLLLDELTRLLPDDTYLERLNVNRSEVALNGQSSQAAKLVEILQASPLLRSPALSGPIQPDTRTGKDRFNITAGYGPQDAEGEASDAAVARR